MNILVITGDKKFKPGHLRFEMQKQAVSRLEFMFWGRGSLFPRVPAGQWDVVSVQDPFWRGLFGWHVARKLGAKFNVQVHTDLFASTNPSSKKVLGSAAPQPDFFSRWVRYRVARFVLRHADSVRVVSEKLKQQVERFGVRAPITVLPIFVDIERFNRVQHLPHTQKTILWVGRFEAEKDPFLALEVFRQVGAAGIDAKLILLGRGSLESALRAKLEKLSLPNLAVELPSWQDPAAYLAQADVVLCTSRYEGYGASMVEALAAGVAVVAPDVGIAKEAGAIVVPREGLAAAVIEVLRAGVQGRLQLPLLPKEEWVNVWKNSL